MEFMDELDKLVKNIDDGYSKDEWIFVSFHEKYIKPMQPYEAFDMINYIIPYLLKDDNIASWNEIFDILISLANKSNTTEVPAALTENMDLINNKVNRFEEYAKNKFNELCKYYRI